MRLHLTPTPTSPHGLDLSTWTDGFDIDATLDDLAGAIGGPPQFAGIGATYLPLDGGHARATFTDDRGWKEVGNLVSLTVMVA